MIDDVHLLESVKGKVLDNYLSYGWYRMGQFIFTTHAIELGKKDAFDKVFWLRYKVDAVSLSKKNKQILKLNEHFTVRIHPFELTNDIINLHKKYVSNVKFRTSDNLNDLLIDTNNNVYDSMVIEIRDKGVLIAAGIFDKGEQSIAGIVNFYNPDYKKYSPGKYIMLLKFQYCINNSIPLYYPGYYSTDNPVFDYKLFLDKNATEVYLPWSNKWIAYETFTQFLANK